MILKKVFKLQEIKDVLDKDAPSEDAPVANQPDIVASELDTPQKLQSAQNTLKARIQNMDSETQKAVKTNVENDANWNSDVAVDDLAGRQKNVEALNTHVQNASKDPNTRFQDDDLGAENIAVEDTTQTLAQPVLGSSGTGVFTGTQAGSVPTSTGGTSITSLVDNNTANLANKAEGLTQKTMDTLSDKVGVDFGDLTAKEVGTSLVSTMAESGIGEAVGTVTAGLGAIGGALSPSSVHSE
jgi:hypothetical protein